MRLSFDGPFAATNRGLGPPLAKTAAGANTGIYLWSVPLQGTHRASYLGKTEGATCSFSRRIKTEVGRFLKGRDGCFDLDAFKRGIRKSVPLPTAARAELLEALIECNPIFVASVPPGTVDILALESHLIRVVQDHSAEARGFITHRGKLVRRPFTEHLEIAFPSGVWVEGLSSPPPP